MEDKLKNAIEAFSKRMSLMSEEELEEILSKYDHSKYGNFTLNDLYINQNIKQYKIVATYDTGDNLNQYFDEKVNIGLICSNLDIAKENLLRLKEHYLYYKAINTNYFPSKGEELKVKKIIEGSKKKDWYYECPNKDHFQLYLIDDDNNKYLGVVSDYCNYFGKLTNLKIVIVDDLDPYDTEINFN